MHLHRFLFSTLLTGLAAAGVTTSAAAQQPAATTVSSGPAFGKLPLAFEPNHGQADPAVQYIANTPTATVYLTGPDAVLRTASFARDKQHPAMQRIASSGSVRMHLAGAAAAPKTAPAESLPGTVNYMTTNDRQKWHTDVPTFGRVNLAAVYPGVDLTYYGNNGRLEYDFMVAADADPAQIRIDFQGAKANMQSDGSIMLPVAGQDLTFGKPVAYQQTVAGRVPVDVAYAMAANGEVSFRLGAYDRSSALVIDPQLVYFGALGNGQANNTTYQVVVDSAGATYYIGTTANPDFPVTPGALQTVCGPAEGGFAGSGGSYCQGGNSNYTAAYVAKISPDGGTLLYSTYLSGHLGVEGGYSIAVDSSGIAYLLGETASNDFPITSDAFQSLCQPGQPAGFEPAPVTPFSQCDNYSNGGGTAYTINGPVLFYAKLNAAGNGLLYSSFLGGTYSVYGYRTALDSSGNWYIYGQTGVLAPSDIYGSGGGSVQFPGVTTTGYQAGTSNAVSGVNGSPNTYGSCDTAINVVSKFSNDGKSLLYGTFFGDLEYCVSVQPQSFALGGSGVAFLSGYTSSSHLPTTAGALKSSCTVVNDAYSCTTVDGYIASFNTTKSGAASLVYSTRLGGSSTSQGSNTPDQLVSALFATSLNHVYATGYTFEPTFPTTSGTYQPACPYATSACNSAFLVELNSTGTAEVFGTFLGASDTTSVGSAVAVDSAGKVFVTGETDNYSHNFPQVNSIEPDGYIGNADVFFSEFSSTGSQLLFSTLFTNPGAGDNGNTITSVGSGGLALDASDDIVFIENTNLAQPNATPGSYSTPTCCPGDTSLVFNHTVFGKISNPLLEISTTTVTATMNSAQTGANATFDIAVSGGKTTPTGNARVYVAGLLVGSVTLVNGSGKLTAPLTSVPSGADTVGVVYQGDGNYGQSTGYTALTVSGFATTAGATLSATTVYVGQPVTVSVTVKRTGSTVVPAGTVTFIADGAALATVTLNSSGVASYTASTAGYPAGNYTVNAQYNGDSFDAPSNSGSATVTLKSTVATASTLSISPNPVTRPATVTATAKVTSSGGTPMGTVVFYVNGGAAGSATLNASGVATFSAPSSDAPGAGTYPVYAVYQGSAEYQKSTSNTVQEVIK